MTKSELVTQVVEKTSLKKKDVASVVDSLFATISEALATGERVRLVGFGTFEVRVRAARNGRDIRTGQPRRIPAGKRPAFRAGAELKKAVL